MSFLQSCWKFRQLCYFYPMKGIHISKGYKSLRNILFSILICSPKITLAQESFTFHHLNVKDGLSQSTINCLFQDSRGFLWIGTADGLDKYDGYTFRHYRHVPHDITSLSSPTVESIFEDVDGKLWIGTDGGGLNIFDINTEKFISYKNNPNHHFFIS